MPNLPPSVLADPLWAHLAVNWKPIPKRPGYVLGLIVSAMAIVLLPLLYLAMMLAVVAGVIAYIAWRAADDSRMIHPRLDGMLIMLLIAAAIFVLIFMVKPLFAPSEEEAKSCQLKQFEELNLHSFVENVCTILGAPTPKRIDVTCEVNASAGFRGGVFASFFQRVPVLTIGLPLVAGMSKAQFAGVLAHEFGHFAQGTGMRLTRVAMSIVNWVQRAAYERDAWDMNLYFLSLQPDPWAKVVAWLMRAGVFLSRQLIKPVALLGLMMLTFTRRRMEYDADSHEIQFCGSDIFVQTCHAIEELGLAHARAIGETEGMFDRARALPDDLPAYIAAHARRLTPEQRDDLATEREREKNSLFRTHPPMRLRIAFARSLNLPGLYTDNAPARDLFHDFRSACRKATSAEFRAILGPDAVDARSTPVAAEAAASEKHAARIAILPRYLGYDPPTWRPVFPILAGVPDIEDPKPVAQRLRYARQELKEKARAAREKSEAYRKAAEEQIRWEQVRAVMDAKLRVDFKALHIDSTTRAGVSHKIEQLTNDSAAAADIIDDAGDMAMHRLSAALSMLGVRGIERAVPDAADRRRRADVLLAAAAMLRETLPLAALIRRLVGTSAVAVAGIKSEQSYETAKPFFRPLSDEIRSRLDDVRRIAGGVTDPFDAREFPTNLGETLVGTSPSWRDIPVILDAGSLFVDRYADCYRRVLSELVEIGEHIERSIATQQAQSLRTEPSQSKPT